MSASRYVTLSFELIVAETEKALLVRFDEDTEEWIPLGQLADPDDYSKGDGPGDISLTRWICDQKELEYDDG